jgi:mutator protein MutT
MKKKARITAGAIIFKQVIKDGESTGTYTFLVVQRAKDDHFPLHWEFPRGSCDRGETVSNCMMREVKEESGLDVVPVKFLGKTEYFSEVHQNITKCFIFLARSKGENIKINANGVHEHEDGKWLIPEVVREMVLPDQRIFIDRALDYLKPSQEYQISHPSKHPVVVKE